MSTFIFDRAHTALAVPGSPEPRPLLITNVKNAETVARIC